MTSRLSFTFIGMSTDPFDEFFIETHGGTMHEEDNELVWDDDCDETVEDDYSENDQE